MAEVIERAHEIAAVFSQHEPFRHRGLAAPFGLTSSGRWRVSPDVGLELDDWHSAHFRHWPSFREGEAVKLLLGMPLVVDEGLPPNSMVLEEALGG